MSIPLTVVGSCHHDCPDTCSWEVTVEDGRATRLRGASEHPFTRGSLCPKVSRYLDRVYHPERVLTPLRRVGPKGSADFEAISWTEALTTVADRIRRHMSEGRADRILQYSFAGTQGVVQMGVVIDRLFDLIGASDVHRDLCGATSWQGAADVLATPYAGDPEDIRHARTVVLWGTNTRLTNRHLWPYVEDVRREGGRVIAIDPVRTDTARHADIHVQPRPGSDVALVLGILHVLDRESLLDQHWLESRTTGWPELRASALTWTPERTAAATGVTPSDVVDLAVQLTDGPTAIRSLIGPEHRRAGRQIMRAIAMLAAVLGHWDHPGGGLFRSTQVWFEQALAYPARTTRPSFNMARLGEILAGADSPIDLLVVHNCNPAVTIPGQEAILTGLGREDLFTVVIEQFMTDTAAYADIVLPSTTQVEHLDLGIAWGHLYLSLNQPAIAPVGDALPNSEIARRLAAALGIVDPLLEGDDVDVIRALLASGSPLLEGITYERLQQEGWAHLVIPDGARPQVDAIPGLPDTQPMTLGALSAEDDSAHRPPSSAHKHPLVLLSRKQERAFLNSHYGAFPAHQPRDGSPALSMHATDASARGIVTGDSVRVFNERSSVTLACEVSEDVQPGLVTIPFGWWLRSSPEGRAVNALANPSVADDDRGSAYFHDTYVEVCRL